MRERHQMAMLAQIVNVMIQQGRLLESATAGHGDRFEKLAAYEVQQQALLTLWDRISVTYHGH